MNAHQRTVSKTVAFVVERVLGKYALWNRFPSNNSEVVNAQQDVLELSTALMFEMKNLNIAVTSTYVATCNGNVDGSWQGSVHDNRIWKNSEVHRMWQRIPQAILLGDAGYRLEPFDVTPFKTPATQTKQKYNKTLKKE
ncbi:DDE Tnp 4 domain containing protein, partial [Asbolus verrucosus]